MKLRVQIRKGQARGNLPHRSKKRAPRSSKKTRRSRNLPSHAPKLERSLSGKQNKMLDLLPKHSPCDASRANKTSLRHTGVPPTDGHSKVRDTNSPWKNPQNFFFFTRPSRAWRPHCIFQTSWEKILESGHGSKKRIHLTRNT